MTPSPICPHCNYDLQTQLKLQHPNYDPDAKHSTDTFVELRCDDCGHIFIWPRVVPPEAPRMTGISWEVLKFFTLISALIIVTLFVLTIALL